MKLVGFESGIVTYGQEPTQEQVDALIDLLYAIGIPRPLQNGDKTIFCSSHPAAYIENGQMIDNEIIKHFHCEQNVFFILWYTDNYFESQACLNEMGAVWVMNKQYQEILMPGFERNKIGGLLPKEKVSFYANDKFRLNTFKEQIEKMFSMLLMLKLKMEIINILLPKINSPNHSVKRTRKPV